MPPMLLKQEELKPLGRYASHSIQSVPINPKQLPDSVVYGTKKISKSVVQKSGKSVMDHARKNIIRIGYKGVRGNSVD